MNNRRSLRVATLGLALAVAASFGLTIAQVSSAAGTTSISGTVRLGPQGFGFADVTVMVLKPTAQGGQLVGSTLSAADGSYDVTGLAPSGPGGYIVCFTPGPSNAFIGTCFANSGNFTPFPNGTGVYYDYPTGSNPVVASSAHPATHIDGFIYSSFDFFTQYGSVSGKVTDLFGVPLSFVKVWAIGATGNRVDVAVTSKQGTYTLGHMPVSPFAPPTYAICFDGGAAQGGFTLGASGRRCYKNAAWSSDDSPAPATATPVTAVPNGAVTNINVKLSATL